MRMELLHQIIFFWQPNNMMLGRVGSISAIGEAERDLQMKKSGSCLMYRMVMLF